jgi:hypothetical protein
MTQERHTLDIGMIIVNIVAVVVIQLFWPAQTATESFTDENFKSEGKGAWKRNILLLFI